MPFRNASTGPLTLIGFGISFLYALYVASFGLILPAVGSTFAVGATAQGRLFPTTFGGAMLGVLLCGYLSDRFGRKPVTLCCLGAVTLGALLFFRAQRFSEVLLATTLLGAGGAAAQTVASALLSDLHPRRRPFYMNAMQVAFGVGATLSSPLMQGFQASGGSWRYFFLTLGVGFSLIFIALSAFPIPSGERSGMNFALLRRLTGNPAILLLCLSAILYAGAEVSFFSWMPSLLQQEGADMRYAASVGGLFWMAMTLGRALTGGIIHRFPLRRLRFLLASSSAAVAALTLGTHSPTLILIGVALTGLCFSGIFSVLLAEGSERFPETAGTVLGMTTASSAIGVALLPYAVGLVAGAGFSWRLAICLAPAAAFAVALLGMVKTPTPSR